MSDEQIPENPEDGASGAEDPSQTPVDGAVAPEPSPFAEPVAEAPVAPPPEDFAAPEDFPAPEDGQVVTEQAAAAPQAEKPKRRKIDLKSRLSSVRGTGAVAATSDRKSSDPLAFPPPPATGSVPAPKLPGVPAAGVSSPFAQPEPEVKQTAQQQTIKVEMGEEVVAARKKSRKKLALYVGITAVVCAVLGFQLGKIRERGTQGFKAVEGATGLSEDISEANKTMSGMSDAIRGALEALGNDEYPDDLAEVLKSTNVPFSSANFKGRAVGSLPAELLTALLKYNTGVEKLNKNKDLLRNLVGTAKPQVVEFWAQKAKPVMTHAVVFTKNGEKVTASVGKIKEPFVIKEKWPASFTVIIGAGKKAKEQEAPRYKGGKFLDGDDKYGIPIDGKTIAKLTIRELVFKLRFALDDTKNLIDGVESPRPDLATDGLLKEGERLIKELKKVAQNK